MNDLGLDFILATPVVAIILLLVLPGHGMRAYTNIVACFVAFLAACSLFYIRPVNTPLFLIDEFNIYLVVLNTFIGFTTSL